MEKLQSKITDAEWVRYRWVDVTTTLDVERRFLQIRENTPAEASEAARQIAEVRPQPQPRGNSPDPLWRRLLGK